MPLLLREETNGTNDYRFPSAVNISLRFGNHMAAVANERWQRMKTEIKDDSKKEKR